MRRVLNGSRMETRPWLRRAMVLVCGCLALAPLAVMAAPPAQEDTLDPAVRAFIQESAARVAASVGLGVSVAIADVEEPVVEEPVVEEPVVEEPVVEEPTGEVVLDAPIEVSSDTGVTLMAPANWEVEPGEFETILTFKDDSIGLDGELQDFGDAFPGLVIFPIFEGQADALVATFGEGAVNTGVSRMMLEQGVPVLRIGFAGLDDDGTLKDGAIYIFVPGSNGYGLFIGSDAATWAQIAPAVDAMVESLSLDEELLTLLTAPAEGLVVDDPEGEYSLTAPEGWKATQTQDEQLRIVLADPEVSIVGATVVGTDIGPDDEEMQMLIEALAGSVDDEAASALLGSLVETLDMGSDDVVIDPEQTEVIPTESDSLGLIKLVGMAPMDDGPVLPLTLYLNVFADKVVAAVFFGDGEDVARQQETIVGILESVVTAE